MYIRGICYFPKKRAKRKETQGKKIPVKIENGQAPVACRRASEEYTVKKKSRIMPCTASFPFNNAFSQTTFFQRFQTSRPYVHINAKSAIS